jgi:hypothetical protein
VLPSGLLGGPIVLEALLGTRTYMNPGSINSNKIEEERPTNGSVVVGRNMRILIR